MTHVSFFSQDGRRTGFSVVGHSEKAEPGEDIVCAAITGIVRCVEATLNDVLGVCAKTRVEEDSENFTASVTLKLPAHYEEEDAVQAILDGMMLTISTLRDENPDYIEVMEV